MNQQVSPISQMLYTLGLTREDLSKRSDEMRHFLTSQGSPTLRVADRDISRGSSSASHCSDPNTPFSRPLSRSCSGSLRESSPPITPVKKEPSESSASLRHYDSMEVVIERQRRQTRREKRSKKEKERDSTTRSNLPPSTSPSPSAVSHASLNLDSFMHSRDDGRVSSSNLESSKDNQDTDIPVTPQKHMYYREHTRLSAVVEKDGQVHPKAETSNPTRSNDDAMPPSQPGNEYRSARHPFRLDGSAEASTSQNPVTPQKRRSLAPSRNLNAHHLPSSPLPSSPLSSPSRPVVNLVSSPGPMGPPPDEDEYERLPYTLPPGPYSPNKPDLSYAALVGQAILSSPDHRLTLQEIYDWITIVYPHYKRGETTWMNSIRHVLSTTVCFRKVPRDRSVGRTLWAIWDEDLDCFKDGGFRKHLCKDIMKAAQTNSKIKGKARKRSDVEEDNTLETRRSKKSKKSSTITDQSASTSRTSHNATPLSHPLFPPSRPTPHHQPYYESCILQPQPQSLPAEIIFPPLPPTAYTRLHAGPSETSGLTPTQSSSKESPNVAHTDLPSDLPAPSSDASSMLSVPELTPNRSSSSPPPSLPLTSEVDLDDYIHIDQTIQRERSFDDVKGQQIVPSDGTSEADSSAAETDVGDETLFRGSTLGPVQFWGKTPRRDEPMADQSVCREDFEVKNQRNSKRAHKLLPSLPTSPTLELRSFKPTSSSRLGTPGNARIQSPRIQASPSLSVPQTPPRSALQISSVRTPLSHKGLHMSPTASLAHYKSNLDPPPIHSYMPGGDDNGEGDESSDSTRTPRRRTAMLAPPVTPKRLASNVELPFRPPLSGSGSSPFRTPGSKSVFDPHDPSALLDEELNRTAAGQDDSPVGLFGKGRGSLLYDSPGALGSPGKWFKWW
ncbi:hypothetical protein JOM56_007411 [Amanita muscaria]